MRRRQRNLHGSAFTRSKNRLFSIMDLLRQKKHGARRGFLDDQFLIAMPGMKDDRFARSVIYICAHSDEGAMGLIINQAQQMLFPDLLVQLGIMDEQEAIRLPPTGARLRRAQWRSGGPQPRLRAAFGRLQGRVVAAGFRRYLPDGDGRYPARHFGRARPAARLDGAGLFRLGRRPARKRDRRQWLADLSRPRPTCCSMPDIERKYDRILASIGVDLAHLSHDGRSRLSDADTAPSAS